MVRQDLTSMLLQTLAWQPIRMASLTQHAVATHLHQLCHSRVLCARIFLCRSKSSM